MQRILITGAAGKLGRHLRTELRGRYGAVRLSDVAEMESAGPGEEVIRCDLRDREAIYALMESVDAVLHFGGLSLENTFDNILQINVAGTQNVFEGALMHGVSRVIFASSNHAIGMYPRGQRLDAHTPPRPDTFYGLSKAFGELLARMYYDKHGIEAACLRIGSCFPQVTGERQLATWLSYADLVRLVTACLDAPRLGYVIVYGVSNNDRRWWDNDEVEFLGYRPQDNAQDHADSALAGAPVPDPDDPAVIFQGGSFVTQGGRYTRKRPR